ncbi:MAG: VWA-like domain-containing protein [Lentisphaeria bacterium]|jgi:predicted metal-dependent peptidase
MQEQSGQYNEQAVATEIKRWSALRLQMLEKHPFWGYLLLQMKILPAPQLPKLACTDTLRHIWLNPHRTMSLSNAELGFVLAHEICHQVFANLERRGSRDPRRWNVACDYAVNATLMQMCAAEKKRLMRATYKMPAGGLYKRRFENMLVEVIYENLKPDDIPACEEQEVEVVLSADGEILETRLKVIDHAGGIDLHLPLTLSRQQQELLHRRLKQSITVAKQQGGRGYVPGKLLKKLAVTEESKRPWPYILQLLANGVLSSDEYTLSPPHRRYWEEGFVLPTRLKDKLRQIVVAVDTSGSMSMESLKQALAEIKALSPLVEEVWVIVADAAVQQVINFQQLDKFLQQGELSGGGGTDHICVFDYIAQQNWQPELFIGISDLESTFPELPPPYPVLWLTPRVAAEAPWGKVIVMSEF